MARPNTLDELYLRADFLVQHDGGVRISGTIVETGEDFDVTGTYLDDTVSRVNEIIDARIYEFELVRDVVAVVRLTREGMTIDSILNMVELTAVNPTLLAARARERLAAEDDHVAHVEQGDGLGFALSVPVQTARA